jgi:hypothetical protein
MSWIDFVGYLAALMVLATFCMDTIVPLRGLAIASNVLFILYGIAGQLYPVLLLHAVLLPVKRKDRSAEAASATRRRQADKRGPAAPRRAIARLELHDGFFAPGERWPGAAHRIELHDLLARHKRGT